MTSQNLTNEQKIAVETIDRSICILAGAGCGKTKVLIHHYLALLFKKRLRPSEIVAVTFTEKAANQLKQKIQEALLKIKESLTFNLSTTHFEEKEIDLILEELPQSPISTLHGLSSKIIRDASLLIGIDSNYKILNPAQVSSLQYQAVSETLTHLLEEKSKSVQILIKQYGWSNLQNQIHEMLKNTSYWKSTPPELTDEKTSEQEKENWLALRSIFLKTTQTFEKMKLDLSSLDFNDLEEKAISLLKNNLHVKRHYQKLMKAFLVDEFQDTNPKQEELLSLLLGIDFEKSILPSDKHLAIVGDPKQSIYSFREANPEIFKKFQTLIEKNGGKTVYLSHNFRSSHVLVEWVNDLCQSLFSEYHPLTPTRFDLPKPTLEILQSVVTEKPLLISERRSLEARLLAKRISSLINEGISPKNFFILFRSSTSIPIYTKALQEEKILSFVKSTESLLEQQEILDLIHAIRAVVEPENNLAWIGLLRSPLFGISDEVLLEEALKKEKEKFEWFNLHPLAKEIKNKNRFDSPSLFIEWLIEKTEITSLYNSIEEYALKSENILQFLNFAFEWEKTNAGGLDHFLKFLDQLLARKIQIDPLSDRFTDNDAVTLMTIHQSKGLDLPIVVLPDLYNSPKKNSVSIAGFFEEKIGFRLPIENKGLKKYFQESESLKIIHEKKKEISLKEEDRIFYVAVTRAVEKIILGFLPSIENNKPSPFLYQEKLSLSLKNKKEVHWISEENLFIPASTEKKGVRINPALRSIQKKIFTHFAVTQLECYLRSPEEYIDRYIYQIPATLSSLNKTDHTLSLLDPLEKGKVIHEALCRFMQPGQKENLKKIVQDILTANSKNLSEQEFNFIFEILQKTIEHSLFQPILNPLEGYSEIPFLLSLPPYEIKGSIDRLIKNEQGWKVVDYKTHEIVENNVIERIAKQYQFQMKTYALAATKMIGKSVLETELYFVIPNQRIRFNFSNEEIYAHEKFLRDLIDEMNKKL